MENIVFDDGIKEFLINNDENRVLRFNPSDVEFIKKAKNIYRRFQTTLNDFNDIEVLESADDLEKVNQMADVIEMAEKPVREAFDDLFGDGASYIIFGQVNPITTVNGVTIAENFLNAFKNVIEPYIKAEDEKSAERVKKYKAEYDRIPALKS